MNSEWSLRLTNREFVLWGYGPRGSGGSHIDFAEHSIHIHVFDEPIVLPFELPKPLPNMAAPQIHEQVKKWGWRFEFKEGLHTTGWVLADSREEALEQANTYANRAKSKTLISTNDNNEPTYHNPFIDAMTRIREE